MGVQDGLNEAETFDVVIVGAGISGINTAYRLQTQFPGATFTILEGRGSIGGTWDFFRYPGIRSDSDLFTFGFQWEPWPFQTPIAKGALIKEYMENCVEKYNLGRYIRFHHKVLAADWSRKAEQWKITAQRDGKTMELRANWIIMGTGYYDYDNPLKTMIPGLENFKGRVIHPQYWPQDFDHSGKKIAIIGSGATAVTLLPTLSETAAAVTMVQRSPSYILSMTNETPATAWLSKILPKSVAATLLRVQYLIMAYIVVLVARYFPQFSRKLFINRAIPQLPKRIPHDPHFEPSYTPWQQRLCLAPDGDFYTALRENPNTQIVTGHIDTVTSNGIQMKDGTTIDADVIVTATGLQMLIGGHIAVTVNGEKVDFAGRLLWHGSMVQDVPNLMLVIGYVDAAWSLGADATAHILTRLLKDMRSKGVATATPRLPPQGVGDYRKLWQLTSTYSEHATSILPQYGSTGPWQPKTSPPLDWIHSKWGDIVTGLDFSS
ncbi:putative flavin-binding monooxygenase [Nemania sp. NC0429]|nr:putative flavin-binding monooxygenase [Nemania sp. NC0429]